MTAGTSSSTSSPRRTDRCSRRSTSSAGARSRRGPTTTTSSRTSSSRSPCSTSSATRSSRRPLAFRGGTALHKLHLAPAARYSEDIDLVQREPGPIGPTLSRLRRVLEWIGPARSDTGEHPRLTFRFETETGAIAEGQDRDQQPRALRACRASPVRGPGPAGWQQRRRPDVRARRAARDQAPGALPAPQGPRPVRPLVGARAGRPRSRADRRAAGRVPGRGRPTDDPGERAAGEPRGEARRRRSSRRCGRCSVRTSPTTRPPRSTGSRRRSSRCSSDNGSRRIVG